jgi:hypothetical protein
VPRVCTVCTHPKRAEIDQAIALGTHVKRRIASENGISEASLWRHAANCLEPALLEAVGRTQAADSKKLANRVDRIVSRLELRAEQCDDQHRVDQLLKIVRELRPYQELYGKAVGELANDRVNAVFVSLGVQNEAEAKARIDLTRSVGSFTPDDACDEIVELVRMALPQARHRISDLRRAIDEVDSSYAVVLNGGSGNGKLAPQP